MSDHGGGKFDFLVTGAPSGFGSPRYTGQYFATGLLTMRVDSSRQTASDQVFVE